MGNQHSAAHGARPRKNVHWKTAGRPAAPGKPDIVPVLGEDEPNAVTLRWPPAPHDGGAPLLGYQVECNRLGSAEWLRTAPPLVSRAELVLSGLEPPHRYQFRVAAVNAVGRSEYGEPSDVLTVTADRATATPPTFLQHLQDCTALENDNTEFRVTFAGSPPPSVAWFKDDCEIFSSRRTAITSTESSSVLLFHQTLASDEGEIKCTITNRAGHAVSRARLSIDAAPKLRYPRQYEDGLLYEINETIFLKATVVGKPSPKVEWRHDGQPIVAGGRTEVATSGKFAVLKIQSARRSDRGEYQVTARNHIGEDSAAFLVTVTAPPEPPRRLSVARQVDKSVTLNWDPPEDDGGCRVGNYVVEYYRAGWNVWLKATTSRKTSVTLFDLIEGSEYRFRVKAESPYGMSAPSTESPPVRIPGRPVDMDFLAVEARIINDELTRVEGEEPRVSPAPRRKRTPNRAPPKSEPQRASSNEFMLVLYPDNKQDDKTEKRKSFQLDLEDALCPPPLSLSAPELRTLGGVEGIGRLRYAVSSTELLHERAMARFYKAVEMEQEQARRPRARAPSPPQPPKSPQPPRSPPPKSPPPKSPQPPKSPTVPEIYTERYEPYKSESIERPRDFQIENESFNRPREFQTSDSSEKPREFQIKRDSTEKSRESHDSDRWTTSFDEDYTASTVSTDGEYSDEDVSVREEPQEDLDTYSPRNKQPIPIPEPNFVPKPILKRREPETTRANGDLAPEKPPDEEKPKPPEKIPFYKKFTKMPVQKPFPFPKILKKVDPEPEISEVPKPQEKPKEKVEKISDERSVIDYYGNIVKEYGGQKKPAQLYLNTEELKTVAEKQRTTKVGKKRVVRKTTPKSQIRNKDASTDQPKKEIAKAKTEREKERKCTQQVVLRNAERATIVIPIDYEQLEAKAKAKVRSAIESVVDLCLLGLAFYLYVCRDERLAVPLLLLALYRQLRAACRRVRLPAWARGRL